MTSHFDTPDPDVPPVRHPAAPRSGSTRRWPPAHRARRLDRLLGRQRPNGTRRKPPALYDPRYRGGLRLVAVAAWGIALHAALADAVGLDRISAYLLPGGLALLLPRMFGRPGGAIRPVPVDPDVAPATTVPGGRAETVGRRAPAVTEAPQGRAGAPQSREPWGVGTAGPAGGAGVPWIVRVAGEAGGWYVYMFTGSPGIRLASIGGPGLARPGAVVLGALAAVAVTGILSRRPGLPVGSGPPVAPGSPGPATTPVRLAAQVASRRRRRLAGALVSVPLAVTLAVRAVQHHHVVLLAVWTAVSLLMLLVASLTLIRGQYSWQLPERVHHVDLAGNLAPRSRFSLILPARDEPVLGRTLLQILAGDYPHELMELVVMVSHDEVDRETRRIAEDIAARHPNVRVVAPEGDRRSKPLSLEDARRHCTGDLIGVVDAESLIAGGLLSYVNTLALRHGDVGIFQGGVQLMNVRTGQWRPPSGASRGRALLGWLDSGTSWWRARNCLEYYIWFMSRLRFQARARFIPLGGNTVFIRRSVLERLGGWDVACLTEDCDLGVRASVAGISTAVFYHPDLTTREETPESLTKLVVQRTRWMMGFMQVLLKGDWRFLPGTRQRLMAAEMLMMPFFQALAGVLLPVSGVLTLFLTAPTGLVIVFWLPLGATVMMIFSEQAAFREFADAFDLDLRRWDSVRLVLCAPLYQLALSVAAVRATARLLRGRVEWEKTSHSGAHHAGGSGRLELEAAS